MIDLLVTYLQFGRINEIDAYFAKVVEATRPKCVRVYVDDVVDKSQELLAKRLYAGYDVRCGAWFDRTLTLLQIIQDAKAEASDLLIVDSDNILHPDFAGFDDAMARKGYTSYNIMEEGFVEKGKYVARSRLLGYVDVGDRRIDVYSYRIPGSWHGVLYVGRKQAVRIGSELLGRLDPEVMADIEQAVRGVDPPLRPFLTDETTLGFLYYYSGVRELPWSVYSVHAKHGAPTGTRRSTRRLLNSMAFCQFARGLSGRKYPRSVWLYWRYKASEIRATLETVAK